MNHHVISLFQVDYEVNVIPNDDGSLCATYPWNIVLIEGEKGSRDLSMNVDKVRDTIHVSKLSRVRNRFPAPVIYFNGKCVCRSATLSNGVEVFVKSPMTFLSNNTQLESEVDMASTNPSVMDFHRKSDIEWMQALGISRICDLMVEDAKRVLGFAVCSSEKNDKYERYRDFDISVMPYPGVEFFKDVKQTTPFLQYDWSKSKYLPDFSLAYRKIDLSQARTRNCDVVTLTKNYIKCLLYMICDPNEKSLLVHCITGWDRTPLFISLLRLSLWADGKIHKSLNALQMLYLTLAYDWMLFKHQLSHRQMRGEDIFGFCFEFLKFMTTDDFSIDFIQSVFQKTGDHSIDIESEDPSNLKNRERSGSVKLQIKSKFLIQEDYNGPSERKYETVVTEQSKSERKARLDQIRFEFLRVQTTFLRPNIPKSKPILNWFPF